MLNSCRLHWAPSTFSIMNICKGEGWRQGIRQQFLGTTHMPSLETHKPVPSTAMAPPAPGSAPSLVAHHSWPSPNPSSSPLPFSCSPPPALFFHRRGAVPSQFLRRWLCFSWSRGAVGLWFPPLPRLPWEASAGQDPTSQELREGAAPAALSQPALGHQLAWRATGIAARLRAPAAWQLGNKAPRSHKSPTCSIFSHFCLSTSFQFLSCCYSESNKTKKKGKTQ